MMKSQLTFLMAVTLVPLSVWAQSPERTNSGPVIELQSRVTGNREQPQVFHVVPWQSPSSPVPAYDPLESQLREVFGHLERDELRRQLEQQERTRPEAGG